MGSEKSGYIKTYRSLQDWQWYTTDGMLLVWTHILLNARIEPGYSYGVYIDRGQLIVGRKKLSEKLNMSEQRVRTCLNRLKSTNEITMISTSKYTLITVIKWEKYQGDGKKSTNKSTKLATNEQPTTNQQLTNNQPLNKNDKNDKNDKNKDIGVFETTLNDFITMRKAIKKPLTDKALVLLKNKLNGITINEEEQIKILEQSILNNWQSVFPLKTDLPKKNFNNFGRKEIETEEDQLAKQRELVERLTSGNY